MMNFKRILAVAMICIFAFSGIGLAAKGRSGGGGIKAPTTTTKSLTPATKSSTTNTQKTETPKNNTAESTKTEATNKTNTTNANTANKTNTTNTANATTQQSSSRWGSALRNIGLFAGGMFLGSMLSNMFGMGGFMGDILGLIANVVLIGIVIMIIMALYRKFFGKKTEGSAYAGSRYPEDNIRCNNCGWISSDRNNPPKFCPECGSPMNVSKQHYYDATGEQDAEFTEKSNSTIIDIEPPKNKNNK